MKSQMIVAYAQPLQERDLAVPTPVGTEVLVRVRFCGVCHSDVHIHDGYFDLGNDKKLDLSGAHQLPFTLGHEIEGEVVAVGPDAGGVTIGQRCVIYPWIGCGHCPTCRRGDEQLCDKPQAIGVNRAGGFADYVIVPDRRYLLDCAGIADGLAATYMCSGLTAYGALQKIGPLASGETIVIIGLGGVGSMALQFARAILPDTRITCIDVDDSKLVAATRYGADQVINSSQQDAVREIRKQTIDGVHTVLDFVGAEASLNLAQRAVRKGGKVIVVGLFGGRISLSIPLFPLRALSIVGSYVGSLQGAAEMLALVKTGVVSPIAIEKRPLDQAGQSLDDLRQGRINGRVVLDCSGQVT